jgi:hypothetical protein
MAGLGCILGTMTGWLMHSERRSVALEGSR